MVVDYNNQESCRYTLLCTSCTRAELSKQQSQRYLAACKMLLGRKLRDHLQRVLRGELLVPQQQQQQQQQQAVSDSSSSSSADGATAGSDSSNTTAGVAAAAAAAAQRSSSVLDESAAHEWCCAAEALDLATPESFRHQLSLIGEAAQGDHLRTMQQANEDIYQFQMTLLNARSILVGCMSIFGVSARVFAKLNYS
eukprot:20185-Heterococcus_DN1.PRE.4